MFEFQQVRAILIPIIRFIEDICKLTIIKENGISWMETSRRKIRIFLDNQNGYLGDFFNNPLIF